MGKSEERMTEQQDNSYVWQQIGAAIGCNDC